MKRRLSTQRTRGLTLVEVLVSIVVVAIAAAVFIPYLARPRVIGCGLSCASNLKIVGLGLRMWSNDQGDKFPWCVSTNQGGTMEFVNSGQVFRHYLAISNELSIPKMLACSKDGQRTRAATWDQLTNDTQHISYFVGLDADEAKPRSILSGDRNLTTNGRPTAGTITLTRAITTGWTGSIHTNAGNIGFGDGSAQEFSSKELPTQFKAALTNLEKDSLRVVIP